MRKRILMMEEASHSFLYVYTLMDIFNLKIIVITIYNAMVVIGADS